MDPYLISVIALFCALPLVWWLARRTGPDGAPGAAGRAHGHRRRLAAGGDADTALLGADRLRTLKLALPGYLILAQVPLARFLNVPHAQLLCRMAAPRSAASASTS